MILLDRLAATAAGVAFPFVVAAVSSNPPATVGWWAILVAFLALEGTTIFNRKSGDTLSEHLWAIRATSIGRPLLGAAWGWLTWHLWIDTNRRVGAGDLVAIGVGLVAGFVMRRPRYGKKPAAAPESHPSASLPGTWTFDPADAPTPAPAGLRTADPIAPLRPLTFAAPDLPPDTLLHASACTCGKAFAAPRFHARDCAIFGD